MITEISDKQAENTRVAYALMAGIPSELIDLDLIRDMSASDARMLQCNSCGCMAGWLSAHPYFKAQGLNAVVGHKESGWQVPLHLDEELFGNENMFNGSNRTLLPAKGQKQEALERLRLHLLNTGRITQQRSDQLELQEQEF